MKLCINHANFIANSLCEYAYLVTREIITAFITQYPPEKSDISRRETMYLNNFKNSQNL